MAISWLRTPPRQLLEWERDKMKKLNEQDEIARLRALLEETRQQLNRWAEESLSGGWSTHQVQPQRDLAAKIQQELDR